MKVYSLPSTRSSREIQENFLKQLALRVNIEGKQDVNRLQIIIFKPTGRPRDEFDDLVRVFEGEGGSLDEDTIFITARKGGTSQFEPPPEFSKLVLQTSVYLTDENKIDPRSNEAVSDIADVLIQKYGFQPCSPVSPWNEVESGQVADQKQKIHELQQKIEKTVAEQKQEIHELQQKIIRLEKTVEVKEPKINALKRKVADQKQKIHELQQKIIRLEKTVADQKQKIHELQQKIEKTVKENEEEENECLYEAGTFSPEIRFKCKRNCFLRCCFADQIKSVNLGAIKIVITNMRKGMYDFQRTCEKELGLKPGNLPGVLGLILKKSKIQGVSRYVIEGQQLEHLIEEVTRKFELTEDHFNRLLYKIYKQNKRQERMLQWYMVC